MPTRPPECPKCRRDMEIGVLLDRSRNVERQSRWMEGAAEFGRWLRTLKTYGRHKLAVTTLRCTACGYLELYATEPPGD